jgi:hypothetical protein
MLNYQRVTNLNPFVIIGMAEREAFKKTFKKNQKDRT